MAKQLISIIVPFFNEAENLEPLYRAIDKTIRKLPYDFEIIFVDDGSQDKSLQVLRDLEKKDKRVIVIELVRNFGKEIALTAGLHATRGNAAIMMDADLQHPPELIPEFIEKWEKGAEAVVGVRNGNHGQSWFKAALSKLFYKMVNSISDTAIVPSATDFRLVDQIIIDEFCSFTERNRLTRALIDWLGFRHDYVYFTAPARYKGKASYSFIKLIKLAINGIVSHSLFPLKLAGYVGGLIILFAGPFGLFIFIERFVLNDPWHMRFTGPAILAVLIIFMVGIVLVCMGLMALYIANIYDEVINRPLYVVRRPRGRKVSRPAS